MLGCCSSSGNAASITAFVIGVPVESKTLKGIDFFINSSNTRGIPVATVAINGGQCGLLAIEIISLFDESLKKNLKEFRENLHTQIELKTVSYQLLD